MGASDFRGSLELDETHITDDYSDLDLASRHAVQRLLEESSAVGVVMGRYDERLGIVFASRIFAKNLGLDPQRAAEFCGASLRDFVFEADIPQLDALIGGTAQSIDHVRLKDATGAPVYVELNKAETRDANGEVCWLLSVRIVPESETLTLVNEVFQTGSWSISYSADGVLEGVTFGSDLRRMLGYMDKSALPDSLESFYSVIHPDDMPQVKVAIAEAVANAGRDFRLDLTYRGRLSSGSYLWLRSVGAASRRADGTVSKVAGVTFNVDEQRRQELLTQELLREKSSSEELLAGLVRLVDRYFVCNLERNTYEFYKFDEAMGYPESGRFSDLLVLMDERLSMVDGERSISEALDPENLRSELRGVADVYRFDYGIRGAEKYLSMAVLPLELGDRGVSRVLCVAQDVTRVITEELRARQALADAFGYANRASEAKTQFLSQMSHEIRTPMNGIVGMTALAAAHAEEPERVRDSLHKIAISSRHLLSLINEVLDMSKIESGNISLVEEDFNLSDLVESLVTMMKPQVDEKHHELHVSLRNLEHEDVCGDALRLQQVFVNLMGNAIKYTPEGGRIDLTIGELPSNQGKFGRYEFVFEDNGIGMSAETVSKIFEPFSRARDERVERVSGAGLGMPISRNIVRMMAGDIRVESALNVGTRYTVTLFLKLQNKVTEAPEKFLDLDVLVADDDPLALESCCDMLNSFGMRAQGAGCGRLAVDMVVANHEQKRDFFACILDLKMPDMNGIECARAIRRSVGADVPIIIISAYDWSEYEAEAREAGVNAFIAKPLFRSRLLNTFDALVGEGDEPGEAEMPIALAYSGKRVLVVEDNAINREVASELLRLGGLEVKTAVDGEEAVRLVTQGEEGRFDLVLMDVMMPRMDGHAATRAIRAFGGPYCESVPIVAMTANAFAEDVQAAHEAGMNEHISKPLDFTKLAAVLETYCG